MRKLLLTLAPLALIACGQQPVGPDISPSFSAPSFSVQEPPELAGVVMRGDRPAAIWWGLRSKALIVVIGDDPLNGCFTNPADYDLVSYQDVLANPDLNRVVSRFVGHDMQTTVWDITGWTFAPVTSPPLPCAEFNSGDLVARGTSDLHYTDNDFLAVGPGDNKNTHAYGFMANGMLAWTADDSPAMFSGHLRFTWGTQQGLFRDIKINLK